MAVSAGRFRHWHWLARVLALTGSGLALWLVLRRLDLQALGESFRTMRVHWYLAAHAAFSVGLLGSAIRWHLMLRLNHEAVAHGAASVRMVFISQFFNTVLGGPSSGDIPKTALYSRWFGVPAADVLAACVLDRLVATVGGIIFAMLALVVGASAGAFDFLREGAWHLPDVGVWVAGGGIVALLATIVVWGARRPRSFAGRSLRSLEQSARRLLGCSRRSGHALMCAVLTAVLFNITQVFCLEAVCPEPVPWLKLFWMYHVITIVASLPITIAGTGLREGAAMVLLAQYGVTPPTAVAGAMLTLSVHVFWALVGLGLLLREQRLRRVVTVETPESISAVIPTFNEVAGLAPTVNHLRAVPEIREIIVADGGSTDGTAELAASLGCSVIGAPLGRGAQLRAGAAASRGDVIVVVHADTWLSPESGRALLRCLRDPLVVAGGFWKHFRDPPLVMRGSRFRCWLRLWWAGRVLGDQALFVRRWALDAAGGMPELPLMEEIELCRRLRRVGRLALAGAAVTTSTRRFQRQGILRTYWIMWRVARAYRRGVPAAELVRWYEGGPLE
jgi:rSAM/selenodomain-associated transferase 2